MKMSKKLRAIASAALISAMVMSMGGMTALAESTTDAPKKVTITKEVTKPKDIYLPKTNFEFTITPKEELTGSKDANGKKYDVPAGKVNRTITIAASPSEADMGREKVTVGTGDLNVDTKNWPAPGIYRYTVTENNGGYTGMSYTLEVKYFDVYVNSACEAYAYTFVDTEDAKVKDDGKFENSYGEGDNAFHNLTVVKNVTGNQGEIAREFKFTVKVDGEDGENYKLVYGKVDESGAFVEKDSKEVRLVSGTPMNITLANGEQAIIYGLDANDTYTVSEEDLTGESYTTTVDGMSGHEATGTLSTDKKVTFENTKNAITPTGIVMSFAPYALVLLLAGVFGVMFLRKKREEF